MQLMQYSHTHRRCRCPTQLPALLHLHKVVDAIPLTISLPPSPWRGDSGGRGTDVTVTELHRQLYRAEAELIALEHRADRIEVSL